MTLLLEAKERATMAPIRRTQRLQIFVSEGEAEGDEAGHGKGDEKVFQGSHNF
jgi:hypothetical protein